MGRSRGGSNGATSPVLVVLTVVLAVLVIGFSGYLVATFPPEADVSATAAVPTDAAGEASRAPSGRSKTPSPTPTPSSSPSPSPSAPGSSEPEPEGPQLAVLSDGFTTSSRFAGQDGKAWPDVLAQRTGLVVTTYAVSATGYVADLGGPTYEARAGDMLRDWAGGGDGDAIVVLGSRTDAGLDPAAVQAAATRTLSFLAAKAPDVTVVCVGPLWSQASPPEGAEEDRAAVRAAAEAAGVLFVDAMEPAWLPEDQPDLIGPNKIQPTNKGHGVIAARVREVLTTANVLGS